MRRWSADGKSNFKMDSAASLDHLPLSGRITRLRIAASLFSIAAGILTGPIYHALPPKARLNHTFIFFIGAQMKDGVAAASAEGSPEPPFRFDNSRAETMCRRSSVQMNPSRSRTAMLY